MDEYSFSYDLFNHVNAYLSLIIPTPLLKYILIKRLKTYTYDEELEKFRFLVNAFLKLL